MDYRELKAERNDVSSSSKKFSNRKENHREREGRGNAIN